MSRSRPPSAGGFYFETNVVQIAGRLLPARPLASHKTLLSPSNGDATIALPEVRDGSSAPRRPVLASIHPFDHLTGKPLPANCLRVAGSTLLSQRDWPLLPACRPRPRASDIHRPSASVRYS